MESKKIQGLGTSSAAIGSFVKNKIWPATIAV